jgi:hypothetical protein
MLWSSRSSALEREGQKAATSLSAQNLHTAHNREQRNCCGTAVVCVVFDVQGFRRTVRNKIQASA